ncbi:hypothetical protein PYW07_005139 [Mythimna separata]|uniref:Uncharacterized protein n=1 Tax=Mythimna separata TaxID=271217 RepID=A0AAD8DPN8_MYTSE|nr:hypothetical protein PYW07_005139 [Mythimna separata]
MAHIKNVLVLAVMCILAVALTQASHDGQHIHGKWPMVGQPRQDSESTWVTCDFTVSPRMRCHDCNTRLICKRVGGLLLDCPSSFAPYCNNGFCSPVPSVECA